MIDGITNSDALPVLERAMQFAGARHRLITHNIANLSTPDFRPVDLSVDAFQAQLRESVDRRRSAHGNGGGALEVEDTAQIDFHRNGIDVTAQPVGENILFHDGNDRDLDRTMQDLVENFMHFRATAQLMRSRYQILNTAISERV